MATSVDESDEPRAADGRVPGRRGLATRQRLLDVTRQMVETSSYRDLKVVDIARAADASPATFYQYFADVESAVLVLAAEMAETGATELHDLISNRSWDVDEVDQTVAAVADGFIDFWDDHASLIRVMDLAALEGDERFRDLRTWLLGGPNSALQKVVARSIKADLVAKGTNPKAPAGVMISMLAHVAAHVDGFAEYGADRSALRDTMARQLRWAMIGS